MIALDPEFLGGFAPQSKLAEGMDLGSVPFARRPRLDRLRIQGKADDTEALSESEYAMEGQGDRSNPPKRDRVEQEKRKMRGKGKSLKRYLRKQRKNVIDPKAAAVREVFAKERARVKSATDRSKSERPSALDRFHRS